MASRFGLRIDRRVISGMFAAAAAAMAPGVDAEAAPAQPGRDKVYAAFFMGQGGYLFSWGVPHLEQEARRLGITTRIYDYSDVNTAWADIERRRREGYRIALVGYSLGNTTATWLQQHVSVDLLLAIAESSLGQNHPIRKQNTRRAVLWWGPDSLSNAGTRDGFDVTNYVPSTHLMMDVDSRVVTGVLAELGNLAARQAPAQRPGPVLTARHTEPQGRPQHRPQPVQDEVRTAAAAKPPAPTPAPPKAPAGDITCTKCWGLPSGGGVTPADLFE